MDGRRWMLRPGLQVVNRDRRTVQVGLVHAVVLPRDPVTDAVLEALSEGSPLPSGGAADGLLRELVARSVVVPAEVVAATNPTHAPTGAAGAAVVAEHGQAAPEVRQRRRGTTVGLSGPADLLSGTEPLLRAAGVAVTPLDEVPGRADVVVLASHGEPSRNRVDRLVQDSVPHVLVTAVDGVVRVGPFVDPGRTACLRCLDAHEADRDPRRPLVLAQYAARSGGVRADGVDHPVAPTTWLLAVAAAADDVVRFVDGDRPRLWSRTLTLSGPDPAPVRWLRHPRCGCTWGEGLAVG